MLYQDQETPKLKDSEKGKKRKISRREFLQLVFRRGVGFGAGLMLRGPRGIMEDIVPGTEHRERDGAWGYYENQWARIYGSGNHETREVTSDEELLDLLQTLGEEFQRTEFSLATIPVILFVSKEEYDRSENLDLTFPTILHGPRDEIFNQSIHFPERVERFYSRHTTLFNEVLKSSFDHISVRSPIAVSPHITMVVAPDHVLNKYGSALQRSNSFYPTANNQALASWKHLSNYGLGGRFDQGNWNDQEWVERWEEFKQLALIPEQGRSEDENRSYSDMLDHVVDVALLHEGAHHFLGIAGHANNYFHMYQFNDILTLNRLYEQINIDGMLEQKGNPVKDDYLGTFITRMVYRFWVGNQSQINSKNFFSIDNLGYRLSRDDLAETYSFTFPRDMGITGARLIFCYHGATDLSFDKPDYQLHEQADSNIDVPLPIELEVRDNTISLQNAMSIIESSVRYQQVDTGEVVTQQLPDEQAFGIRPKGYVLEFTRESGDTQRIFFTDYHLLHHNWEQQCQAQIRENNGNPVYRLQFGALLPERNPECEIHLTHEVLIPNG